MSRSLSKSEENINTNTSRIIFNKTNRCNQKTTKTKTKTNPEANCLAVGTFNRPIDREPAAADKPKAEHYPNAIGTLRGSLKASPNEGEDEGKDEDESRG